MRPKVVVATLLLAFAVFGTAVFFSRPARLKPDGGVPVNLPVTQTAASPSPAKIVSTPAPAVVTNIKPIVTVPPVVQETNHAVYVQERVAELMALAMNNDSNSLNTIWSELTNTDKDIRAGALAAVVQFGDRSVTPRLRELAAQTQDATEKADIIEAADFLELPSLSELHGATPTNGSPPR